MENSGYRGHRYMKMVAIILVDTVISQYVRHIGRGTLQL